MNKHKVLIIVFAIFTVVCLVVTLAPYLNGEIETLNETILYYNEQYVLHYISRLEWSFGVELAEAEISAIQTRSIISGLMAAGYME